ncbi:DTW domain-containing protein [Mycotypha africana]|uniref:DTW domain-containing protein n=1 Tax=Mycotypha africana TaxID=64632 RepID=UPI0023001326|nr:DTW domain-containing protein [Mycotypha africana]KAI8981955.1 DTW domain-containing protein [Mycotypha africana]
MSTNEESRKRSIDQLEKEEDPQKLDPLGDLKIDDDQVLKDIRQRSACPSCKRSVKYFCYKCYQVVGMDRSKLPHVHLPIHLDVIKHHKELDGKSTAIHAKIISDDKDVDIHTYCPPDRIPQFEEPEKALLLFPGPSAKQLKDIPSLDSFNRVVVIDGTWHQAKQIAHNTPILNKMQKVTIAPRKTTFWRFQNVDDQHLATIEAIYYFYREYFEACQQQQHQTKYDGRFDNLLFYYKFFYNLIQRTYQTNKTAKFSHRHQQKDYIKNREDKSEEKEEDITDSSRNGK